MSSSITSFYRSTIATEKVRATLLALLVFLLPFERIPSVNIFSVTVRASQLVALMLIAVSAGPIVSFYRGLPRLPKLLLPAFLFSYLLSALMATDLKRAAMVFVFTTFVALAASAVAATFKPEQLPRLEKYLFLATVIVVAFGFYQYLGDIFGIPNSLTGLRDIYTKAVFGFPRIQSTGLEPLYYGSFLLIPYCILLAKKLSKNTSLTKFHIVLFVLVSTQIMLTVSRGAIYGGILATLCLASGIVLKKETNIRSVFSVFGLLAIAAVLALILTWIPAQLTTGSKQAGKSTEKLLEQTGNFDSQDDRKRNRDFAVEAFKESPVFGMGPGNFNQYAVAKYPPYTKVAPVIVNNEPLELLAEAGVVGFGLFVLFAVWVYVDVARNYIKNLYAKNAQLSCWVLAILAYLVALAVQYQTFSTLYIMHVWVVIGLLMAFSGARLLSDK